MLRFTFVLVSLIWATCSFAQKNTFTGTALTKLAKTDGLEDEFSAYDLFEIDSKAFNAFVKESPSEKNFRLQLGTKYQWDIQLFPYDIRTPEYTLRTSGVNGIQEYPKGENKTFRGYLQDGSGHVRLTIDEGFINGFIVKDGEYYYIEPAKLFEPGLDSDVFVVYHDKNVIPRENNKCVVVEVNDLVKPHIDNLDPEKLVGECYTVEIAIASDFSMFNQFGSVGATENAVLAILNNVQTNYDNDFDDEVQFFISTQFVSNCNSCDPAGWTGTTDPFTLLPNFRTWGNSGGFGAGISFDVASLWTNRNFNGDTIGLAYVGVICSNSRYNVLEHYTNNASLLRVLQSHELGHNFDANHTGFNGNGTIMAPFINNTNQWAPISVTEISNHIAAVANTGCFTDCSTGNQPPIAGFTSNVQLGCAPLTVSFTDLSSGIVESRQWSFPGGNPATSTQENPIVTYNVPGVYDVTLLVSNAAGSNSSTQLGYITVQSPPVAAYNFNVNGNTVFFTNTSTNWDNLIWDFGDGQSSSDENPVHTYDMDGSYLVSLTVSNGCGNITFSQLITIITPPVAGFTADQTNGCTPFQVQFTNQSSANAGAFSWTFEGGDPATSNEENPLVTYNTAGTFNVTLTVMNGAGSNTSSQDSYVTVGASPSPSFTFTNVDGELLVDFMNTSSDATTYSWDFGDGEGSTESHPSHTYAMGGEYTVVMTATNACGSETFTQVISLLVAPIPGFTVDNTNGCTPYEVQFADESSGNTTGWNWTFEGGTPATSTDQNPVVTYNASGTYDVTLIASNAAGENTIAQTDYITVGEGPSAGFTSIYSVGNTSADFTSTSQNADSYSWNFGDGQTSSEENPSHDFGTDGEYTVTLTVTNECGTDTFTETLTVVTAPSANFEANTTGGCTPAEIQFTDLSSANASGWNWTFEGGNPSSSSDQNPIVTYDTPGEYTVTLEVSNAAGNDNTTFTDYINITDAPTVGFSTSTNDLTVIFTNESTGATSYSWDFGDGEESNLENPQHTYAQDGEYTVELTATNECGSVTNSIVLTVGGVPNASFTSNQTAGCLPFTVEFTDLSSTNTTSWLWTFEGGTPATSSDQNPVVTYNSAGTFGVTLVATNSLGSDTFEEDAYITIGANTIADFSSDINGLAVNFNNNSENADSYNWDFGDDNGSNEENPSHTYAEDGVYEVILIVTNACGSDTSTQTMVIATPPSGAFSSNSNGGCAPVEIQFTDESSSNVESWLWTFEGGNPATSTDQNPLVIYNNFGTYTVSLVVSNSAGESTVVQEDIITIEPQPEPDYNFDVDGFSVDFTNFSNFGDTYEWVFGDGEISSEENPSHTYEEDGTYEVTLKVTNECGNQSITKTIVILTLPAPSFSSDAEAGCAPFIVQFFNESSANTTSVKWTFEGGTPATTTEENPVVLFENPGTYSVTLTAINGLGEVDIVQEDYVSVNDIPDANFNFDVSGFVVNFMDNSDGATSYNWDFGDDTGSNDTNPSHTYELEGTYTVVLTAENECGTSTFEAEILIDADLPIAGFTAEQTEACAPFTVTFNNESSENSLSYEWTFEGGNPATSTDANPEVTFENPGLYTITLVATNGAGSDALTRFDYIFVEGTPVADFGYDQIGFDVDFINISSLADNFIWEFGDGDMSTEENPSHTFDPGFSYSVQLIVINECGTDTISQVLNFEGQAPEPMISASQVLGCTPFEVGFTDMSEGEPTEWNWTFEGATPTTSTDQNPVVVYEQGGTFDVTLEASNIFGTMTQTFDAFITVEESPEANFDYTVDGLEVSFNNLSGGSNLAYEWVFGDTGSSEEENPVYTYDAPGLYDVFLLVKNGCGSDTITIELNLIIDNIDEAAWVETAILFPNPNNGDFILELNGLPADQLDFQLFNVLGQSFYRSTVDFSTGRLRKQFKLGHLAAGVYLLEIRVEGSSVFKKVVVE